MGDKDAFVRQRRNLIVMSFLIIVLNLGDAQLTSLNLLGNEVELGSPDGLTKALALVLLYFFVRYFQYLHVLEGTGTEALFKLAARDAFKSRLLTLAFHQQLPLICSGLSVGGVMRGHQVRLSFVYKDDIYKKPFECVVDLVGIKDGRQTQVRVQHSSLDLVWPTLVASLKVGLRTPAFTEYVLPPLFACIAFSTFFSKPLAFLRWLL